MRQSTLSSGDLALLHQVATGHFQHITTVPQSLQRLIKMGLVEALPTISFPVMPTVLDCRLTLKGYDLLQQ